MKLMKTKILILLTFALFSAGCAISQPSTRIDLTQLVGPDDTSKVNFVITEGDTAYYEYQLPSLTFDTAQGATVVPGLLTWNTDESTLDIGLDDEVTLQTGQEMLYYVKNQTGSTINDGQVVQFKGSLGASGRLLIALARADTTSEAKYIMGVATEEIANGADGFVTAFGKIRQIDTDGSVCSETWADGDILYLSATTAGCLTNTPPAEPSLRIPIAAVVNAANNGTLFVRPTYYPNLDDLHNVTTDGATNGQVLVYNSSSGVWEPGTASGGSSLWSEGATSGEIYYNSGNVGIGTTDPRELLDVDGGSIRLESSDNPRLRIYSDDGAETSYLDITDFSNNYVQISKVNNALIDGFLDIDVLPQNNTKAIIRLFRNTNTTDVSKLEIYKGNNTSTRVHRFATNTESSFVNFTNNIGFGVGTNVPSEELDVDGDARIRGHILLDPQSSTPAETDEGILFYDNVDNRFSGYSEAAYKDLAYVADIDSTRILQDSIAVYYAGGSEIGRDTIRLPGGTSVFTIDADTVRTASSSAGLDFVFGSTSLDDTGTSSEDQRFFFDNSKGYFFAGTATGTTADDINRGLNAINLGINNEASGSDSNVSGGFDNEASGTYSTVSGGQANTADNTHSTVGGGWNNRAGAFSAVVGGGSGNTAIGNRATTSGGLDNLNNANYGTIGGGRDNNMEDKAPDFATIPGGFESKAMLYGSLSHSSGSFDTDSTGQAQNMQITVRASSTGTGDFDLFLNGDAPFKERIKIDENNFWSFSGNCVMVITDIGTSVTLEEGDSRMQTVFGKAQNYAGTVTVDSATPNLTTFTDADNDMNAASFTFSPDATNDALTVTCSPPDGANGGTATTVTRAVCTLFITQTSY